MFTNLQQLHSRHKWLVGQMRMEVHNSLRGAGKDAADFVRSDPGFNIRGFGPGSIVGEQSARVMRTRSGAKLILRNDAPHAMALEHGAGPHIIRPRRAKFLHFWVGGHEVFTKLVNHPGNQAYRFLSRAAKRAGAQLVTKLHARLGRLFKRF